MTDSFNGVEEPKIVVLNISQNNIQYCIENSIQGITESNKITIAKANTLVKGDICIIRQTSKGGKYNYGVVGIWFFDKIENMVGKSELSWNPPMGWKFKLYMKPIIHKFDTLFEEDFSKSVINQLRIKESSKINGLLQNQLQGAITAFADPALAKRSVKAIMDEKKSEFQINIEYENMKFKRNINAYNFLSNLVSDIDNINNLNFFIFVFNEQYYEDHSFLGSKYFFPSPDKGGLKLIGKSTGSWGAIIDKIRINDKVIWTISGNSERKDKKTFWGHGEIKEVNQTDNLWEVKSEEFIRKISIDEVVNRFPDEYKELYLHSQDKVNIGFYGTIQIDKFQYNKIIEYCEELQVIQEESELVEDEGEREVQDKENHNSIVLKLIQIGKLLNFDVWVASDLKNVVTSDIRLGDLTLDDLSIPGVSGAPLSILKRIDVLWLKNKDVVIAGFEVEHTTPIFSGLLRFFDLFISIPSFDIRTFIVAPDRRVNQVKNQFNRKTFQKLINETRKKIGVIYYSSLNDGYGIIESIYKSGGNYNFNKFLDNCMNNEWNPSQGV